MPVNQASIGFLKLVLGGTEGYFCYCSRIARTGEWFEHFIELEQIDELPNLTERTVLQGDLYFCPTPLREPKCKKENIEQSWCLWADLDTCDPSNLLVEPSIVVETSPGRWQAYWLLEEPMHALEAEKLNKRIAYHHAHQGCDKSGWDLTQRLRVPGSTNFKRFPDVAAIRIVSNVLGRYKFEDFSEYPDVAHTIDSDRPMPTEWPEDTAEDILDRVKLSVSPRVWPLFQIPPTKDWSKSLWQLQLLLMDVGLTDEEVFIVCHKAACNKYERDGRIEDHLWREIVRARKHFEGPPIILKESDKEINLNDQPILSDDERLWASQQSSFVERYVEWAKTIGDAAWQYHQAGAFVILSTLLSGAVRLPTSFGTVYPNVWFMILADTTLTRKSTAMDLAMDFVVEFDKDAVLATDGSIEGLMGGLATRANRPSIFLRDEFSGLLEAVQKKDYYAGMLETLTKLYDGKYQKKILRKEIIEVQDPRLIIFAGGIRSRILQLLTHEHVASGFLPRFVFITAESDINRLKPLGPPTEVSLAGRSELLDECFKMYQFYNQPKLDNNPLNISFSGEAKLESDAWLRYNAIEARMLDIAIKSNMPDLLTPTFDRMCKTGLKVAMMIAASKMQSQVIITQQDLVHAFYYVEQWKIHTLNVISGIGTTQEERLLERVYNFIKQNPKVNRSRIMQQFKLNARAMDNVSITLEQRHLIHRQREGRGENYTHIDPL